MEQLPLDLLAKVLCCLPLSHHKLGLQVVCKKWRDALCDAASHELRLDDNGIPQADDSRAYTRKKIKEGGIRSAFRPLPDYQLKVLPSAPFCCVDSRLAAGGLEHILLCEGIPSQPTTLPNVRTLRFWSFGQLYEGLTPQRFPSLRQLVLLDGRETPLNLHSFQGLKYLIIGYPDRSLDGLGEGPAEVPALSSVPADCCVLVHINQASLLGAKHELQAKGYTHTLTILCVKVFTEDLHGVEKIDLQHLSVFTHLHTVYIDVAFYGYGI